MQTAFRFGTFDKSLDIYRTTTHREGHPLSCSSLCNVLDYPLLYRYSCSPLCPLQNALHNSRCSARPLGLNRAFCISRNVQKGLRRTCYWTPSRSAVRTSAITFDKLFLIATQLDIMTITEKLILTPKRPPLRKRLLAPAQRLPQRKMSVASRDFRLVEAGSQSGELGMEKQKRQDALPGFSRRPCWRRSREYDNLTMRKNVARVNGQFV